MPVPTPIGLVHYNEPRAVQVREPENLTEVHSTVFAGVHIYVDNALEREAILDNWASLMEALSVKVDEIISGLGK